MKKILEIIKIICSSKRSVGIIMQAFGLIIMYFPEIAGYLGIANIDSEQVQSLLDLIGKALFGPGGLLALIGVADHPRTDRKKLNAPPPAKG